MRTSSVSNRIKAEGVTVLHLPTRDLHAPSIEQLEKGIGFIKNQIANGGKVYVHCRLGEGRGPTMAIAYLIGTGMLYEDAFKLVKGIRPYIRPTKSQRQVLQKLETMIHHTDHEVAAS
jgi:dual specificity MAP kinase phosphatase